jgi:hypothetical protein
VQLKKKKNPKMNFDLKVFEFSFPILAFKKKIIMIHVYIIYMESKTKYELNLKSDFKIKILPFRHSCF